MIWILEVLEGPRQGTNFKLFAGLSIGRKKADINLDDGKISSVHAVIEEFPGGSLVLVDSGSRNGIYANGQRVQQVKLEDGLQLQMGQTYLKVSALEENEINEIVEAPGHWRDVLVNFNHALNSQISSAVKEVQIFTPVFDLEFIQGQQLSTRWTFGYGPRRIGRNSLDFPILEKDAPGTCFHVVPTEGRPTFKCDYPDEVKLNGQAVDSQELRDGDLIAIGQTVLKVHLADA